MRPTFRWLVRYGIAVVAVAAAIMAPQIPVIGPGIVSVVFFAVLVSAWYGGFGPGLLTTALIVAVVLVVLTIFEGKVLSPAQIAGLASFLIGGVLICLIVEALHAARRRAEADRGWLAAVLASIGDAVIATDGAGRVTFLNPVADALTGWAAEEAVGRPLDEVFPICHELTRDPVENPVERVLREGVIVGLGNHTILIARDGHERPIADSAAPIRGRDGTIVGVVLVFRDVTEQARAERERAELLDRERAARDAAEAANRAKDRFLAVLSHELRTPLTPVLAGASALLDDPETPPVVRPTLEMTRRNIELEARLIDDLLDVTRIGQGKLRLEREVVDIHLLIHRALAICRSDLHAAGLRLELGMGAGAHHVEGDPARLQQALWNLLKNAIKFTPAGGTVKVRTRNPAGDVGRLLVDVADTGIGIEPADLARIFDPFEQGPDPAAGRAGGLGLGLAISRWVAEAHGGRLEAASAGPGLGATFALELAATAAPAEPPPSPPEAGPGPTGLRILLVEDNVDTLRVVAQLLRRRGHEVRAAASVAEAIDAADGLVFDLVVSDIGLPDGSGLDLIARLRAERPGLKGIALSGFGMEEDHRRSTEAGFAVHLTKPIDFRKLEAAIQRVATT